MLLNSADDVLYGQIPADAVYADGACVWQRACIFILDPTRYNAEDAVLYSTTGTQIAQVTMRGDGRLTDVTADAQGLHVTGQTDAAFPVTLAQDEPWTIVCRIRGYVPGADDDDAVHTLFTADDGSLAVSYIPAFGNAMQICIQARGNGGHYLYNGVHRTARNGFLDGTILPERMQQTEIELRWVSDGSSITLYTCGVCRVVRVQGAFPTLTSLHIAGQDEGCGDRFTVTDLRVYDKALPPEQPIYRLYITGWRGEDAYTQLSRLCLYDAAGERLDRRGSFAYVMTNGVPAEFSGESTAEHLIGTGTDGKVCYVRSRDIVHANGVSPANESVCIVLPAGREAVSYSLVTADDAPERDPVTWTLSRSTDGGRTWIPLDSRTNADIPAERLTESERFPITMPGCYRTADGLRYCTSDGRVYRLQEE